MTSYVNGKNWLFLDTCSILDFASTHRDEKIKIDDFRAAKKLMAHRSDGEINFIACDQVNVEFLRNIDSVRDSARQTITPLEKMIRHLHSLATELDFSDALNLDFLDHLERQSAQFCSQLLDGCDSRPANDASKKKAFERSMSLRKPAQKGKDSLGDCVILETYLDAVRKIRAEGRSGVAVFLSSNVKDYCNSTKTLHEDLAREFDPLQLKFASNFRQAVGFFTSLRGTT